MNVKRYEWVSCDEHACHCDVVESAEGDMVDYDDYAALEARCTALAAENAGLKAFKTAVYQQMGAGCEAPEFSITEGQRNLRRFADTLHAIEREFFTKEVPDEEYEGETVEECPLTWGMSVEQYVAEFRKCLAEVRAQAHKEGAHFVANRMLAAWDAGFIDDTAKNAADIARMILTSTEFMAGAPVDDFDRSFADGVLEDIAAQLRKGVQS
ncbi:ead/Ea22-like family protein [Enterobacter hormaechei]|nr:ead/Ea22-like family protein [Enterobacter hormaechei]MEC5610567.1 ead/Ea22-like family protein [Enterobacter hormaechei]